MVRFFYVSLLFEYRRINEQSDQSDQGTTGLIRYRSWLAERLPWQPEVSGKSRISFQCENEDSRIDEDMVKIRIFIFVCQPKSN